MIVTYCQVNDSGNVSIFIKLSLPLSTTVDTCHAKKKPPKRSFVSVIMTLPVLAPSSCTVAVTVTMAVTMAYENSCR